MWKKLLIVFVVLLGLGAFGAYSLVKYVSATLPDISSLKDYRPLLVSQVFDRKGRKIGEYARQRRILIPYEKIPKDVVNAFLAAEDDTFFQHGGVNYQAIIRAAIANFRAGQTVQGGSTITQQVAKTLILQNAEKTLDRKLREFMLAHRMEENLSKEDILYLYLNQIYFGNGAYGIVAAAETYFRKPVEKLTLAEAAILAGLPKAPSAYSPTRNPSRAKERQVYVLHRMRDVGFATKEATDAAVNEAVKIYFREKFEDYAPHFLEAVRLLLIPKLTEDKLLDEGLRIHTSLDLDKQMRANESVLNGLKEVDKRQGFRGPKGNTTEPKEVGEFLLKTRDQLILDANPLRTLLPEGKFTDYGPLNVSYDLKKGLPFYLKAGKTADAIVSKIDDEAGLVYVRVAELEGIIDIESMTWARKPNPDIKHESGLIRKPSQALKMGDLIEVKVVSDKFASPRLTKLQAQKKTLNFPPAGKYIQLELDQEPELQSALLSIDKGSNDVLALVGGIKFGKGPGQSEYNRALQAARQTGSSFKTMIYASALDKGYTPTTPIMDAPLVFEESQKDAEDEEGQEQTKVWKPTNHSKKFGGDILFRNALVMSLNVPSVKIMEDVSVKWGMEYARRLGIFSPLNPDFTLVLGSSSVTLYEMTRAFATFSNLGKRVRPVIIHRVEDHAGKKILDEVTIDSRFEKELKPIEDDFEERRKKSIAAKAAGGPEGVKDHEPQIFFEDEEQMISPQTAFVTTQLLKGVVEDPKGTAGRARAVGREVVGKTGTTNGYYDAWFIGYSPQITTGVWVGFDKERTIGKGEVGGRAALPIWVDYMKYAHEGLPVMTFPTPDGIVFANVDSETGFLASSTSKKTIRMAFKEGTEPKEFRSQQEDDSDFYKRDATE